MLNGLVFFTEQLALTKGEVAKGELPTKDQLLGMRYTGYVGELPVMFTVMKNGTASISVGNQTLGLNNLVVKDIAEILVPNQLCLAAPTPKQLEDLREAMAKRDPQAAIVLNSGEEGKTSDEEAKTEPDAPVPASIDTPAGSSTN